MAAEIPKIEHNEVYQTLSSPPLQQASVIPVVGFALSFFCLNQLNHLASWVRQNDTTSNKLHLFQICNAHHQITIKRNFYSCLALTAGVALQIFPFFSAMLLWTTLFISAVYSYIRIKINEEQYQALVPH